MFDNSGLIFKVYISSFNTCFNPKQLENDTKKAINQSKNRSSASIQQKYQSNTMLEQWIQLSVGSLFFHCLWKFWEMTHCVGIVRHVVLLYQYLCTVFAVKQLKVFCFWFLHTETVISNKVVIARKILLYYMHYYNSDYSLI